jgi:hypothetical protein
MTPLEMLSTLSSKKGGYIMDIKVTDPVGNERTGIEFNGPVGNIVAGVLVGLKISAAIKIQALFRGYATKRVVEVMRPNLEAARKHILKALVTQMPWAMTERNVAEAKRRVAVGTARSQLRFGLISVCLAALKEKNYWYPYRGDVRFEEQFVPQIDDY